MATSYARCSKCQQVVEWHGAKAQLGDHVCGKPQLKPNPKYRKWFIAYATHLSVKIALRDGAVSLDEVRDELNDVGLIEELGKQADVWLLEALDREPFTLTDEDQMHYSVNEDIEAGDFPEPKLPPPAMFQ